MQPVSSTVRRAHGARVLGAMLVPLALGVAACGGGGSADTSSATTVGADSGSTTTTAASADAGSSTTVGAETGSTVSDATTKWCTAFRSVDQNPASVDEISMMSIVPPRDDLEFPWIFVIEGRHDLHTPKQDDQLTQDYTKLKTFADTYCTG